MVLLELVTCVDGYWSNISRTGVVGNPNNAQVRLMETVEHAQQSAIELIKPGVPHEQIDMAARDIIGAGGYGDSFIHDTGHHTGFRYHDFGPAIARGAKAPLQEGMIITVEPGAYGVDYGGGCRYKDDVLVTSEGYSVLSDRSIKGK